MNAEFLVLIVVFFITTFAITTQPLAIEKQPQNVDETEKTDYKWQYQLNKKRFKEKKNVHIDESVYSLNITSNFRIMQLFEIC